MMKTIPKMRYRIVEILGDFYYKEMPMESVIEKVLINIDKEQELKNYEDIDKFISTYINVEIPLNRPQY